MPTRKTLFVLKAIVSAGLVATIFCIADLKEIPVVFKQASLFFVLQGLSWMAAGILVRTYKWYLLLRVQSLRIPLLAVLNLNVISMFFNNFFLGTLGGDVFRAFSTAGFSQSVGQAASSVIMDRLTGILAALLIVFSLGFALLWESEALVPMPLIAVLAVVSLGLIGLLLLLFSRSSEWVVYAMMRPIPRLRDFTRNVCTSVRLYGSHRLVLLQSMVLSLLYYIGQSITVYCFALAVHSPVPYSHVLFVSVIVGLLVMIPISLNGLGIQEGSYAYYLANIGVAEGPALVIVILSRAAVLVFSLLGAALFVCHRQRGSGRRRAIIAASADSSAAERL